MKYIILTILLALSYNVPGEDKILDLQKKELDQAKCSIACGDELNNNAEKFCFEKYVRDSKYCMQFAVENYKYCKNTCKN